MPYKIVKNDSEYCVWKHDDAGKPIGKTLGCHKTEKEAAKQMAALYAAEKKAAPPATREGRVLSAKNRDLISAAIAQSAEAIKALQDLLEATAPQEPEERAAIVTALRSVRAIAEDADTVTIAGYGVVWGGRDMYGTTFTPQTDFWTGRITAAPLVLYDHGLDGTLKKTVLGTTKEQKLDTIGLWIAAQLYKHQEYMAAVQQLVADGVLGWSSGAVSHLVDIERETGEVRSWPIVEYSLTPTPAEPRTLGVEELRSLAEIAPAVKALIPGAGGKAEKASLPAGDAMAVRDPVVNNSDEQGAQNMEINVEQIAKDAANAAIKAMKEEWAKEPIAAGGFKTKEPVIEVKPVEPPAFKSMGEYLQAVVRSASGQYLDPRLAALRATGMGEGVPADGGFLLQTTYSDKLLEKVYATGEIIKRVFTGLKIGPNSNSLKVPYVNESSRVNGSRWGGVQAYWLAEAGTKTATKPALGQIELSLKKVIALMYVTDELLADVAALEAFVNRIYPSELRFKVEDGIVNGTGAGQPLGILNAPCLVTQAKETGQAAATVVSQNIIKMWSRLYGPSRPNAVWLINQDVEPQLHQMSLAVGTGGVPVWMPAGGLSGSPYSTLYGRPVIPCEYCATLGTVGDIILADLDEYALVDKGGIKTDSSIHVNFLYDETAFRWVYRVDGQPMWVSALTPYKGTATQGPFVALAVRA